ncbi:hypothetical protein HanLR1_Chr03g0079251 [Helianthus annuus]|nr:hypothetical protein HanLR1_Chr03g0079251 [Helianthus annuus]
MENQTVQVMIAVLISLFIALNSYRKNSLDVSGAFAGFFVMVVHLSVNYSVLNFVLVLYVLVWLIGCFRFKIVFAAVILLFAAVNLLFLYVRVRLICCFCMCEWLMCCFGIREWLICCFGFKFVFGAMLLAFFFTSSKLTKLGEERKRSVDAEFKAGGQRNC